MRMPPVVNQKWIKEVRGFRTVLLLGLLFFPALLKVPFLPNVWMTTDYWIMVFMMVPAFSFLTILVSLLLLAGKRAVSSIVVSLLIGAFIIFATFKWGPSPESRWQAERTAMIDALGGPSYGVQHAKTVDGRQLTFWHIAQTGIDNAYGYIHDPEDRLSKDTDDMEAFVKVTGGVIYSLKRMEANWYFVSFS